jgi:nucleoside-specific outer membrane channel protein Tsx
MLSSFMKPTKFFKKSSFYLLFLSFMLVYSNHAVAQVIYQGGSDIQFLYGRNLNRSGDLATVTFEHFGSVGAFDHFGFADISNDVSLKSPDLYLEWYPKLSLSRATGHEIKIGPIKDISVGGGINVLFGGPEDFFASLAGTAFKFNIPGNGLLQLETFYYKQNGAEYDGTYQITPSWDIPLPVSEKVHLRFRGFMDFIGDRGPGTKQYLTQPQLFLDLGNTWAKPGKIYLGSEWRYWNNVAGIKGLDESILQANLMFNL